MPTVRHVLFAALATAALATPAFAQGAEPWDLKDRMAYAVAPDGKMMAMHISDKGMTMMMKGAKKVPRGTVFFMSNGQLYMMSKGAFDRAGNFMGGGG
jgi:hypothetical protein